MYTTREERHDPLKLRTIPTSSVARETPIMGRKSAAEQRTYMMRSAKP
jgi:hypothetical protein